jgi:hypothetical protein
MKDENGELLANSHNILNRWKNYFSQLLNVHGISHVRQIKICTAEALVSDPSPFEAGIAYPKLKKYKLPGSDEILAEPIEARVQTFGLRSLCSLILFGVKSKKSKK